MATQLYKDGLAQPRVYRALLSQTGTDAPTAIVLENTLGFTPTYQYSVTGRYRVILGGNVNTGNQDKMHHSAPSPTTNVSREQNGGDIDISISTFDYFNGATTLSQVDGKMNRTAFEILIYP